MPISPEELYEEIQDWTEAEDEGAADTPVLFSATKDEAEAADGSGKGTVQGTETVQESTPGELITEPGFNPTFIIVIAAVLVVAVVIGILIAVKGKNKNKGRTAARTPERAPVHTPERAPARAPERVPVHTPERAPVSTAEPAAARTAELTPDVAPEPYYPETDPADAVVPGIAAHAEAFEGLYESLYLSAREPSVDDADAYDEWCDRAAIFRNDGFDYAFASVFSKDDMTDDARYASQIRRLLKCVAAAGVKRVGDAGLTFTYNQDYADMFECANGDYAPGGSYKVVKPAWVLNGKTIESGLILRES